MKKGAVLLVIISLILLSGKLQKKTHLVILSGQSNMVNIIKRLMKDDTVKKNLVSRIPDDEIVLVKKAFGGKRIIGWIKKEDNKVPEELFGVYNKKQGKYYHGVFFDAIIKIFNEKHSDVKPDTVTVAWMQGESDGNKTTKDQYLESLNALHDQFKKHFNTDVHFIIGRLSDYIKPEDGKAKPKWYDIRKAQEEYAASDSFVHIIDTDDISMRDDNIHYDSEGSVELEKRFTDKIVSVITK
jgi:hypothetical protein